jgi:transcriptional regulator with XRE-family HTH domain
MKEEIKDRILQVIKKHNLNASLFSDKLGVQRSSLSHILSGRNKPSLDFITRFIESFPDEDIKWLIHGVKTDLEPRDNQIIKTDELSHELKSFKQNKKEIEKIITFYTDKTFDIYIINT